jgi:hypothetical protein
MRKYVPLIGVAAVVVGVAALFWAFEYRQRTTQPAVTRGVYREFGRRGSPIVCVSQTRTGSRWNCRSVRWGDDPACRQVFVSVTGVIDISHQTGFCEA